MLSHLRLVTSVSAALLVACGASESDADRDATDGGPPTADAKTASAGSAAPWNPRSEEQFLSLTIESEGSGCIDCWSGYVVRPARELCVADAEGEECFELTPEEYSDVLDPLLGRELWEALHDPLECPLVFDAYTRITVDWSDVGTLVSDEATGCIGRPGESSHPYALLFWKIIELKKKYLECPPVPTAPWDTTKPPPIRMLCYACGGNC